MKSQKRIEQCRDVATVCQIYRIFSSQSHLCREFKKETGMTPPGSTVSVSCLMILLKIALICREIDHLQFHSLDKYFLYFTFIASNARNALYQSSPHSSINLSNLGRFIFNFPLVSPSTRCLFISLFRYTA